MADLSIEVPRGTSPDVVGSVADELEELDEVEQTSAPTERSVIGVALLLVNVAGPVLEHAATALPVVQKIIEALRGRGVTGATIELPDGTKISVDNASAEDIERILEAAKKTPPEPPLHCGANGALAQLGERRLCKPEVTGSIPVRSIGKLPAKQELLALGVGVIVCGQRPINAQTSSPRVETRPDRFLRVAGEVTVTLVDHRHAGPH